MKNSEILQEVFKVILERKGASASTSYTASLYEKGIDTILKKIGEESAEVIIAGKGGKREEIIHETADLIFHALVLLGYYGIELQDIYDELGRRFGTSGLAEKESRQK